MSIDAVVQYLAKVSGYDRAAFTPLSIRGQTLGLVNATWRARLLADPAGLFQETPDGLACTAGGDYATLSRTLHEMAVGWRDAGWLNGWRNENFTAFGADGTPLFELERAAFRPLGLLSRAVHLNGLTRAGDGSVRMWVGRRSPDKAVDPNRMDNLMGGGIAAGETLEVALEREGWEEAGIPAERLELLQPVGRILAQRPVQRGLHREWLYVFDLWLQAHERPANQDGEVAEHVCLTLPEVEALIVEERFMIDAALVTIDCLCRLNYWGEAGDRIRSALAPLMAPAVLADTAGGV
ncbi:NUDIX domain [Gulbenkiania indica]|uniref:NUDIX domain n=1 Tax=Gulbenkiania indica TaxID=375574 RepID=A0A0K6GSR9_9NEIS|nr:NUDIX hydrolase family protein [Gulbenkiania indica]CUA81775.1 NUDIX domain [Gulbenkiania indica]